MKKLHVMDTTGGPDPRAEEKKAINIVVPLSFKPDKSRRQKNTPYR